MNLHPNYTPTQAMVFNTRRRCGVCMGRKVQDPMRCTNIYHLPPPGFKTLIFPPHWGDWQPPLKAQAPTFGPLDLKVLLLSIVVFVVGANIGVITKLLQIERLDMLLFKLYMMSNL